MRETIQAVLFDLDGCLINTEELRPHFSDQIPFVEQEIPFDKCVYNDVKEVLEELRKRGICLGIFSQAIKDYKDYQKRKAKEVSLDFFDEEFVFIVEAPDRKENELERIIQQLQNAEIRAENVLIVDDMPLVLQSADGLGFQTARIRRKDGKYSDAEIENFEPDYNICALSELLELI